MDQAIINFFVSFMGDKYGNILASGILYTLKGMLCVFVVVVVLIIVVLLLNIFSALIDNRKNKE